MYIYCVAICNDFVLYTSETLLCHPWYFVTYHGGEKSDDSEWWCALFWKDREIKSTVKNQAGSPSQEESL